jgi:phosphatidylglycerophosphatase C
MSAAGAPRAGSTLAVFDLDGTITRHDTLLPYLAGFVRQHPRRWPALWRIVPALLGYAARHDRGRLKSHLIRAVMGGEPRATIDAWSERFVQGLEPRGAFHRVALEAVAAHRRAGDHLVLLSASPDLYVPRIGELLGFERTLCTEVRWEGERLDGELLSANRRDAEKARCLTWLRSQYPGLPVIAYGNSASDLPHLRLAERAVLVNVGPALKARAESLGIHVTRWS